MTAAGFEVKDPLRSIDEVREPFTSYGAGARDAAGGRHGV